MREIKERLRRAWIKRVLRLRFSPPSGPLKLHVGSGPNRLEGWVNLDLDRYPGVDLITDVTKGLPFSDVQAVFAEHFLEHLSLDRALDFLSEVHRVLMPGGLLRLSTPNLDWVVLTHRRQQAQSPESILPVLHLNRAFHGWGHRFLWTRRLLGEALEAAGFDDIQWCDYGESRHPELRGLEGHVAYPDHPEERHVLIVEATRGELALERIGDLRSIVTDEFLNHTDSGYSAEHWKNNWLWQRSRRASGSRPAGRPAKDSTRP